MKPEASFFKDDNDTIHEMMRLALSCAQVCLLFGGKVGATALLHGLGHEDIGHHRTTHTFRAGHSAKIYSKGVNIGMIGEISDKVCAAFRIRKDIVVVAFEVNV